MEQNKTIVLSSAPIAIAEDKTCKYATFLISVLDEYDRMGRKIPLEAGEKNHETLRGFPIVAKLVRDRANRPVDFGGHEMRQWKRKNGETETVFNTYPIGSVTDTWIESREVSGYEGEKPCMMAKAKLWTSRSPEYFSVFDKLWNEGKISSSWELEASEIEQESGGRSILKSFSFIGNALLGTNHVPAVCGAGVYEYAEADNESCDPAEELTTALLKDINDNVTEQEDTPLADELKKEDEKKDPAQPNPDPPAAPASCEEEEKEGEKNKAADSNSSNNAATHAEQDDDPSLDLSEQIETLRTALIKANEIIEDLKANVQALEPFKAQMEQIEQEKQAAEKKEQIAQLRQFAADSKQFTDEELAEEGGDEALNKMIADLDIAGIKAMIADRLVKSFTTQTSGKQNGVSVASMAGYAVHKTDLSKLEPQIGDDNLVSAYIHRNKKGR